MNESVKNDATRRSLHALAKTRLETLWRLTDGNHELQSSVIAGLDKFIQRMRSGYSIDIQSWSGDELNSERTVDAQCIPIPGIKAVPNRGREHGRYMSRREERSRK